MGHNPQPLSSEECECKSSLCTMPIVADYNKSNAWQSFHWSHNWFCSCSVGDVETIIWEAID
jgi:hypothetical protein